PYPVMSRRSPVVKWAGLIDCVPSHGILSSARAPGVRKLGTAPASASRTDAIALFQGQSSVNTTAAPSGVEVWQPTHCTSPGSNPGLPPPYVPLRSRPSSWITPVNWTRFGVSVWTTPSAPTLNPRSLVASGPTAALLTVQNPMLPTALTGAIRMSPRPPLGVPGELLRMDRIVTVIGKPALFGAAACQIIAGIVHVVLFVYATRS